MINSLNLILLCMIFLPIGFSIAQDQSDIEFYVIGFGVSNGSVDEDLLKAFAKADMNGKYIPAENTYTPEQLENSIFSIIDPSTIVDSVEIRGQMYEVKNGATYTWGPQNFSGFYYDIDKGIGTESINLKINDGFLKEQDGIIYKTSAQRDNFKFDEWGEYWSIGFLGENYFAGYFADDSYYLYKDSEDANLMLDEKLTRILKDKSDEYTFATGSPLELDEGYKLIIESIDSENGRVYVELQKDGITVDKSIVEPSKNGATIQDKTYTYNKNIGNAKKLVLIAVHFKNAFKGAIQDLATIDGVWQISDTPIDVKQDTKYDKMTLQTADFNDKYIEMSNQDHKISLRKGMDTPIMGNIMIRTADQERTSEKEPLRFYIYKKFTQPGIYVVRSSISEVKDGSIVEWNSSNFAGFYYDMDKNLGDQKLTLNILGDALEEPNGLIYTTSAQKANFVLDEWSDYWTISLLDKPYFVAYSENSCLYDASKDTNFLEAEQLASILYDDDEETTLGMGSAFSLKDGYEIRIKEIDQNGRVSLDLAKDGEVIDESAVVDPSKQGATETDKTYTYKSDLGDLSDVVVIAVHFNNAMPNDEGGIATVDGVWQISDKVVDLKEGSKFGTLTIDDIDPIAKQIVMKNKGSRISLKKHRDITLMGNIRIKTADQNIVSFEEPLRFYIFEKMSIMRSA